MCLTTGAIFCETRPETIMRSAWRGEARDASLPNRALSKRAWAVAIISIAQQARPNCAGHSEFRRAHETTRSTVVVTTLLSRARRSASVASACDPARDIRGPCWGGGVTAILTPLRSCRRVITAQQRRHTPAYQLRAL